MNVARAGALARLPVYRLLWGTAFIGLLLHLAGIAWDVYLHAEDEELAAREGVFTLSNPGHALIFAGVGITTASLLGVAFAWLAGRRDGNGRRVATIARLAAVPVIGAAAAGSIWLATLAQDDSHPHAEVAAAGAAAEHASTSPDAAAQPHGADGHAETSSTTAASTGPEAEGAPHTHAAEVDVTEAQLQAASTFVAAVKADVAKYEDVSAALADGYVQITQDLPAIAAHFVRMDYLQDGHEMDPERPEFLLYSKRLDGSWRLLGVMFYAERESETPPSYFGPLDTWHYHEHLCFTTGGVRVAETAAQCVGQYVERTHWQLHVWTRDGADGVFAHDYAPINPGSFPPAVLSAAREVGSRPN